MERRLHSTDGKEDDNNQDQMQQRLAQGTDPSAVYEGNPPMCNAANNGHEACLTLLLQAGARVDQQDKEGATALWIAAGKGHQACLTLLLQAGAAVDQPDKEWATPLWAAAQEGHEACLSLLLQAGSRVDQPN